MKYTKNAITILKINFNLRPILIFSQSSIYILKDNMKTIILTHADCDGICAGAIALSRFPKAEVFFTKPVSFMRDLSEIKADIIIITDIAMTKTDGPHIVKILGKKKAEVLYFDHHVIPDSINEKEIKKNVDVFVHDEKASASELIFKYYQKEIPRERVWAALYGAIGDYTENTQFVSDRIKNWDRRAIYFEVSTIVLGIKREEFTSYDEKRKIVRVLANGDNPSDVDGLVMAAKKAVNDEFDLYDVIKKHVKVYGKIAYSKDVHFFGFRGQAALFSATAANTAIGLCIYRRRNHLDITIRSRDKKMRLNKLIENAAESVGGSGGGHPQAAGARIPKKSLDKFLKNLNILC